LNKIIGYKIGYFFKNLGNIGKYWRTSGKKLSEKWEISANIGYYRQTLANKNP